MGDMGGRETWRALGDVGMEDFGDVEGEVLRMEGTGRTLGMWGR